MASKRLKQVEKHIAGAESKSNGKMPSVMDLFSLTRQTALVTGGTRGIGQAMTIALAEAGADIILVQVRRVHQKAMTAG